MIQWIIDSDLHSSRLWSVVTHRHQIDPEELLDAAHEALDERTPDYRTRLLLHESLRALADRWGAAGLLRRVRPRTKSDRVAALLREPFEEEGFPSLRRRVMETTKRETVLQFLRELGEGVGAPVRLDIGGSTALILDGLLSRVTEDIDVVDELPAPIRAERALLKSLMQRYDLTLAHFQSHYLPSDWSHRVHSVGRFGLVDVRTVDPYDIFVGKLFSRREKDLDDLRVLASQMDVSRIIDRLTRFAQRLLDDGPLRENAQRNWQIVYGEALPATPEP